MARPARPTADAHQSDFTDSSSWSDPPIPPIHPAGLPFIAGGLALAAAGPPPPLAADRQV